MKLKLLAASTAILLGTAGTAMAQQPWGYGGLAPGYGTGYAYGGPGAGAQAPGYGGMAQQYSGGYGGPGPGFIGAYGATGRYGPLYGMGTGQMGGLNLNLSPEQVERISAIHDQYAEKRWELIGKMHQQQRPMFNAFGPGPINEKAARRSFESMSEVQKDLFELALETRKKVDNVLTSEQRQKLGRGWNGGTSG